MEVPDFISYLESSDNCGIESIEQYPNYLDTVYGNFTTTFLVTDSAGNSNSCTFDITLYDSLFNWSNHWLINSSLNQLIELII